MRKEDLKLEDVAQILEIYAEVVQLSDDIRTIISPEMILRDLQGATSFPQWKDGYRIGSKWNLMSKLYFTENDDGVHACFDPNMGGYTLEEEERLFPEATEAKREFRRRVDEYLESREG